MGEFELNLGVAWGVTEDVCGSLQSSFIDMYMIGRTLKRTIYIYICHGWGRFFRFIKFEVGSGY